MDSKFALINMCVLLLHGVAAYQDHLVSQLCPSGVLNTFNKLLNNRPEVRLGFDGQSAAFVHETWNSSSFKRLDECKFNVDANHNLAKGRTRGLYASIRKLNLRESPDKEGGCIDYIQFKFGTQKTAKLCGQLNASSNTHLKQLYHHHERGGVMKVTIFIDKLRPLKYIEDTLDVELVFTAFDDCDTMTNGLKCDDDACISEVFANDGYANCPPPSFSDEPPIIVTSTEPMPNNTDIVISALTSLIFTLVGVGSCLWLCWHVKDCFIAESAASGRSSATASGNRRSNTMRTTTLGGTVEEGTTLEMPATSSNLNTSSASAPPFEDNKEDKPPSYDSLFPKETTNS